ncbi:LysR substrate-binding domain-containing protein [Bradyrhizobium cajani]|uniref:LysR family transcriptional regulator n=1 Tax=Bradyrhizobium cajani TaxID=1928661 RepID=A0A844TBD0_9BRAD|nr:LysR substrate-binding domain-containing protein [Bradyrhizobium cajani]MCP3371813.1 LysR substrate-binding domain-containing protein [Bradyrhizobium cajani]MVT76367.1 LysR family transcriptional regulator [Bradyrhizobium cajani]
MNLVELRAFTAVAKGGGFVRAAGILNRSQPTITAQIKNLEGRYNVELFFRGRGRTSQLTPLGERLFEITQALFQLEEDASNLLSSAGKLRDGIIRIGAIAPRSAINMLGKFHQRYPNVDVKLTFANSEEILSAVIDCRIDVGFLGAHEDHPACDMYPLSSPEIVLIAHSGHHIHRAGIIDRAAFKSETLLMREPGSETRQLAEEQLHRHNYVPGRALEIGSREGVCAAVAAGIGIGIVSADEIEPRKEYKIVRFSDFRVFGTLRLVCLKKRRHSPLIRELLTTIIGEVR